MKKYYSLALAALCTLSFALTGCEKKNEPAAPADNTVDNTNAPVFTATIEGDDAAANAPANGPRKTQLVEGSTAGKLTKVEWLNSDEVFIAGSTTSFPVYMTVIGDYSVTPGADATTAELTPGTLLLNNSTLTTGITYAVYPASISYYHYLNITSEDIASLIANMNPPAAHAQLKNTATNIYLPATQKYNGTDISQIAPMYCWSKTSSLEFCNLNALLAITVSASDFSSVSSIKVSTDKNVIGAFSVSASYNTVDVPLSCGDTEAERCSVTLDCTNNGANTTIASGESKTFYISIPAKTYGYLQIEVTDGTSTKTMKTKAASISVARNKIYEIAFADNQTVAPANALTFTFPNATCWSQNNNIWVNGVEYVYHSGKGTTTGVYVPENEENVATPNDDGKYCAIYPYSAADYWDSGKIYIAEDASFGRYDCPMYAESSTTSGFQFGGFGMLAVSFTGYSGPIEVTVWAYNVDYIKLWGIFDPANDFHQKSTAITENSRTISSWDSNNTLYVPIPSGSYDEITVSAYSGEYEDDYEGELSITDITTVSSGQLYERTLTLVEQIIDEGDY